MSASITGGFNTFTIQPTFGGQPPATPKGLIATRAVETKDGWLGQVIVDTQIVREFGPWEDADTALGEANLHVVKRVKKLLG